MKTIISSTLTILASLCFMSCQTENTPQETNAPVGAVDLGLSVYWAKCNLGAETSYDSGDYYSWGEIQPKTDYSPMNYNWYDPKCFSEPQVPFLDDVIVLKYCANEENGAVDNRLVLEPTDDVAHVKLGGDWYMPTEAEWKELIEKCTWTWTTRNGVVGCEVCSKKNGNTIFLPAAGSWGWSGLLGSPWVGTSSGLGGVGSCGRYWSSSLYREQAPWAMAMFFIDASELIPKPTFTTHSYPRIDGFSVRPVYRK